MTEESSKHTRKHIRFRPDANDVAYIDTKIGSDTFESDFVALIIEESPMGGCGIMCLDHFTLEPGMRVRIKVGKLHPLLAEVMWAKNEIKDVKRYGLKFLE